MGEIVVVSASRLSFLCGREKPNFARVCIARRFLGGATGIARAGFGGAGGVLGVVGGVWRTRAWETGDLVGVSGGPELPDGMRGEGSGDPAGDAGVGDAVGGVGARSEEGACVGWTDGTSEVGAHDPEGTTGASRGSGVAR